MDKLMVWVVFNTTPTFFALKLGINKIFIYETDALNFVKDELSKHEVYKNLTEEELDELAGEFIQQIEVEGSY